VVRSERPCNPVNASLTSRTADQNTGRENKSTTERDLECGAQEGVSM
jgi:hypothetical protein